jgi:hypothetical protein
MAFAAISRSNYEKRLSSPKRTEEPARIPTKTKINWRDSTSFVFARAARLFLAAEQIHLQGNNCVTFHQ